MTSPNKYRWVFRARFRKHAFGWRSQLPIKRIREAVSEIKRVARKDPLLGGEGAVLFFEKISPALEHVDSSSGALGTAVGHAIAKLVSVLAEAPADDFLRDRWLDRLWEAIEADAMPYIEQLANHWGALCASPDRASRWADRFVDHVLVVWSQGPGRLRYYKGTPACLSALLAAGRNEEILALLEKAPYRFWSAMRFGVKALQAEGRRAEAIRFAEACRGQDYDDREISQACEAILLDSGLAEEAFTRYALEANKKTTYLATYRALHKKYPQKSAENLLRALAESTPGSEGKWFAAAKSVKQFKLAIEFANQSPCDAKTLSRAARDFAESEPEFAVEAGLAALRWLLEGYWYEIESRDVWAAYHRTVEAARTVGVESETLERIHDLVGKHKAGSQFVRKILVSKLREAKLG